MVLQSSLSRWHSKLTRSGMRMEGLINPLPETLLSSQNTTGPNPSISTDLKNHSIISGNFALHIRPFQDLNPKTSAPPTVMGVHYEQAISLPVHPLYHFPFYQDDPQVTQTTSPISSNPQSNSPSLKYNFPNPIIVIYIPLSVNLIHY